MALTQGDAVGAMTFGTPPGEERSFAPRKGAQALNALMGELYGVQPTPTHSDYVAAAQALLRRQRKRALVIVITNFRDEDSTELRHALRLLRRRHLVLLASLRERIVGELIAQPLVGGDAAIDVAGAHLYEQARRDAFNRLADARCADGRRRAGAARHRARQPLSRRQACRPDLIDRIPPSARDLAHGPSDGTQVLDFHLFVLARDDDAVGAGGEGLERRLVDDFRVVGRRAGHVEADAGVDLRLAVRAGHAPLRLAEHVVGREAAAPQFGERWLDPFVVAEQLVVQVERGVERDFAENRLLEPRQYQSRMRGDSTL